MTRSKIIFEYQRDNKKIVRFPVSGFLQPDVYPEGLYINRTSHAFAIVNNGDVFFSNEIVIVPRGKESYHSLEYEYLGQVKITFKIVNNNKGN